LKLKPTLGVNQKQAQTQNWGEPETGMGQTRNWGKHETVASLKLGQPQNWRMPCENEYDV
jgi:hypothetical protein